MHVQRNWRTALAVMGSCVLHAGLAMPLLLTPTSPEPVTQAEGLELAALAAPAEPGLEEPVPDLPEVAAVSPDPPQAAAPPPEATPAEPPDPMLADAPPPKPVQAVPQPMEPPPPTQMAEIEPLPEPPTKPPVEMAEALPEPPPIPPPPPERPPSPVAAPRARPVPPRTEVPAAAPSAPAASTASAPAARPVASQPATAAVPSAGYLGTLMAALERHKDYPVSARRRRAQGVAQLRFTLRRDGTVAAWRLERSTGDAELDAAVEEMIRRASPLPSLPADMAGDALTLVVPVRFALR